MKGQEILELGMTGYKKQLIWQTELSLLRQQQILVQILQLALKYIYQARKQI